MARTPSKAGSSRADRPDVAERKRRRRSLAEDALNIPNLLTFGRILMIPLCLWFLHRGTPEGCYWAGFVFMFASLTDALDGYLARKLGVVSVLGKFLDPLADKLLVMACLVELVPMGRIPGWATVILLARELSITGLRSVAASEGVVIAAGQEGKTKTALQMIGLVALIVGYPVHLQYAGIDLGIVDLIRIGQAFIYLSLIFSVTSGVQYVQLFGEAVDAKEKARKKPRSSSIHPKKEPEAAPREAGENGVTVPRPAPLPSEIVAPGGARRAEES